MIPLVRTCRYFIPIAFILLVCASGRAIATDWDFIKPARGNKTKLKVGGKTWSYWRLSQDKPTILRVSGPSELRIYSRSAIPSGAKEVLYGVVAVRDGEKRYMIGRGTEIAKDVEFPANTKLRIGESRSIYLEIPDGEHEFAISLPAMVNQAVFARFFTEVKNYEDVTYIAYLPQNFPEEVRLDIKEREYIYYRSTKTQPIGLEVIGPTRIRAIARLEFDHTMRGDQPFRVQVRSDDEVLKTTPFIGAVSGTATYVNPTDKIISKGEVFYIDVPQGKQKYSVNTPDSDVSILLRFYIPKKDLENELKADRSSRDGLLNQLFTN